MKMPGAIAFTRIADLRELARDRQRHRHHAALGGRIGGLADLAVVGGDRGGRDDDAALAVDRFELAHRRDRKADHVEAADQVDADHPLEIRQRVRPVAADDAFRRADAGAIDQHPRGPMRRGGFGDRRAGGRFVGDVADDREAADRLGRLVRRGGVEIEHRDFRALGGERLRRRPAEPEPPPVTIAATPERFIASSSLGPTGPISPIARRSDAAYYAPTIRRG